MITFLFDVDGVLVDTAKIHEDATSLAAGRFVDCSGGGSTQSKLLRAGFLEDEVPRIYRRKQEIYALMIPRARPNFEVLEALRFARSRGYRMAAGSNSSKEACTNILQQVEILPLLELLVTGGDVKNLKPAPDIYLQAIERLGADPKDCVVFEDSEEGWQAATAAKVGLVVRCSVESFVKEFRKWL